MNDDKDNLAKTVGRPQKEQREGVMMLERSLEGEGDQTSGSLHHDTKHHLRDKRNSQQQSNVSKEEENWKKEPTSADDSSKMIGPQHDSQSKKPSSTGSGLLKDDSKFSPDEANGSTSTSGEFPNQEGKVPPNISTWSGGGTSTSEQGNVLSSSASNSDFNASGSNKATSSSSDSGSGSGPNAGTGTGEGPKSSRHPTFASMGNNSLQASSLSSERTSEEAEKKRDHERKMSHAGARRPHHERSIETNRRRHHRRTRPSAVGGGGDEEKSDRMNARSPQKRILSSSSSVASTLSMYSNVIDEVVSQASKKRKQGRHGTSPPDHKNKNDGKAVENTNVATKKKRKLDNETWTSDLDKKLPANQVERKMSPQSRKQPFADNEMVNHSKENNRQLSDDRVSYNADVGEDTKLPSTTTTAPERRQHPQGMSTSMRKRSPHKKPKVSGDVIQFATDRNGNMKLGTESVSTMSSSQFHGSARHVEFRKKGADDDPAAASKNPEKEGSSPKQGGENKSLSDLSWSGVSSSKGNSSAGGSDNSEENRRRDTGSPISSSEDDKNNAENQAKPDPKVEFATRQGVRNEDISSSADDEAPDSSSGGQENQAHGSSLDDDSGDTPRYRGSLTAQNVKQNSDEQQQQNMGGHNFAFKDKMISYSQHKASSEELPTSSCSDDVDSNSVKSSGDEEKDDTKLGVAEGECGEGEQSDQGGQGSEKSWRTSSDESGGDLLYAHAGAASPASSEYAVCPCLCAVGSRKQREAKAHWMELLKNRPTHQDEAAVKDWLLEIMHAAQNPHL